MDLLLSPLTAAPLSPPRPGHRRCASAPSLDGMAEAALQIETTPCSVLDLEAVDDDVSRSLRRTLQVVQAELTEAVAAGVLRLASNEGDDDDPAGPPGRLHHTAYSAEASGGGTKALRHASSGACLLGSKVPSAGQRYFPPLPGTPRYPSPTLLTAQPLYTLNCYAGRQRRRGPQRQQRAGARRRRRRSAGPGAGPC